MFKGMFDTLHKKDSAKKVILSKEKVPVLSAEDLLSIDKRQAILAEIEQFLNLPEKFQQLFLPATQRFAVFIQNLPETENSYYASLGGWLDHALERASLSLFLCRPYFLTETATWSSLSDEELRWLYAVFTASLVYNIGKIVVQHEITLIDQTMQTVWSPFSGSMVATYYLFGFIERPADRLDHLITPLLARQILQTGFDFIAEDHELLTVWLALLSDDPTHQGDSILDMVKLADAELLASYFGDRKVSRLTLSTKTIALRERMKKALKEKQQRIKEQQEKMAAARYESNPIKIEEKKNTAKTSGSIFLPTAISDENKKSQPKQEALINHFDQKTIKETSQKFLDWIREQATKDAVVHQQADALIKITRDGVLLDKSLLEKFVKTHHSVNLATDKTHAVNQLEQLLQHSRVTNPVNYIQILLREGSNTIQPGLMVINPYLVFPYGAPPPMVNIQVLSTPDVSLPSTATSAETYSQHQQEKQSQLPKSFLHNLSPIQQPSNHVAVTAPVSVIKR